MKFILSADYSMGVGDFLVKLYALCHLNKYIKEKYPEAECYLFIEEYKSNVLYKIFNSSFFIFFFNSFKILHYADSTSINGLGTNIVIYQGETYNRVYSAINDHLCNKPGYWEVYLEESCKISNFDIPFILFDYRDPSSRNSQPIPDYDLPIFQDYLFEKAKKFAENSLSPNFDSIYYRSLFQLDNNHLKSSIDCILSKNTSEKKYFVTSNSDRAKEYILSKIPNSIAYSNSKNLLDGYGTADSDQEKIERLFVEMFIMSYGSNILYAGNHHYISLYNYYAHMIKKIPLVQC